MRTFANIALLALAAACPHVAQAEVYAACFYQDGNTGKYPITQLFTLEDDALKDGYNEYTREKTAAWEKNAVKQIDQVRPIAGYYGYSFVGQFVKFAEDEKHERGSCWMTTDKAHAFGWYRHVMAMGDRDNLSIAGWRPSKGTVLKVEEWPPM
ncbi:hypothetical protein [Sphingopyxis sp.]|uniref:hypothetical protein n=1 Tax=Sphingopyxis sp. TaxID=1908224 RepID=UPI00261F5B2A|nr:hypothetical protein [Sphingopyxis sp.]MCW0198178.1 hypothetical protein [Sphingopyxis sp.]